jgi:hypothetical protein
LPGRDQLRAADVVSTTSTGTSIPSRPTTTSSAPSCVKPVPRSFRPTEAITCAPASEASRTANRPTPPDAPVTSTRRPSTAPLARSARNAATPATGRADACARSTMAGTSASEPGSTTTCSANPPDASATTRVPAGGPLGPDRSTTPATSEPSTAPGGTRPDRASFKSP